MKMHLAMAGLGLAVVGIFAALAGGQATPVQVPRNMRTFDTPYYTLHTDIDQVTATEADLRLTRMFEEYTRRTAGFAGKVNGKFPFYLFSNPKDYYAAGGVKGSAGVFIPSPPSRLMAFMEKDDDLEAWKTVQHEGFHQFVAATMQARLPTWLNEGLAEYFGEAIWTGDNFVVGIAPPPRAAYLRGEIRNNHLKSFSQIMNIEQKDWNEEMSSANYDEAWAMVHFLVEADKGKYRAPFARYINLLNQQQPPIPAWESVFGRDLAAFERLFGKWWMELPEDASDSLYLTAMVQVETSFLARAHLQKQKFASAKAFFDECKPAPVSAGRDLWLPPALFEQWTKIALRAGEWSLDTVPNQTPKLVFKGNDGTKYTGSFVAVNGKVTKVTVDVTAATTGRGPTTATVTPPKPATKPATKPPATPAPPATRGSMWK